MNYPLMVSKVIEIAYLTGISLTLSLAVAYVEKFERKTIASLIVFGYLAQLDGYMVGIGYDDLVRVKNKAFIWYIDKP